MQILFRPSRFYNLNRTLTPLIRAPGGPHQVQKKAFQFTAYFTISPAPRKGKPVLDSISFVLALT